MRTLTGSGRAVPFCASIECLGSAMRPPHPEKKSRRLTILVTESEAALLQRIRRAATRRRAEGIATGTVARAAFHAFFALTEEEQSACIDKINPPHEPEGALS